MLPPQNTELYEKHVLPTLPLRGGAGAEARVEEASAGMEPTAGTMELEQQQSEDASAASRRYTEVPTLPKVDRGAAPATPAIRPGDTSTPATGVGHPTAKASHVPHTVTVWNRVTIKGYNISILSIPNLY